MKTQVKAPALFTTAFVTGIFCFLSLMVSHSNMVIVECLVVSYNQFDWLTLVAQIKMDPATLKQCSKELSTFNYHAAELLLKHSNIVSLDDAKLVVNFKLNEGIFYLNKGLKGIAGIHLKPSPYYSLGR